jgi:hypothetical protein
MQIRVKNWVIPKVIVIWISIAFVVTLVLAILLGYFHAYLNRDPSIHFIGGQTIYLPKDVESALMVDFDGAPVSAVQGDGGFLYLDYSDDGELTIQLDRKKLPKDRKVVAYVDRRSSWRWFQALFADLKNNGICDALVSCERGDVPMRVADKQTFSGCMRLELQSNGEVIDVGTGDKFSPDDYELFMWCRGFLLMDDNHAVALLADSDDVLVDDFVRVYSDLRSFCSSGRGRIFLQMSRDISSRVDLNRGSARATVLRLHRDAQQTLNDSAEIFFAPDPQLK